MQKRSLETRQRILSSALECFALHGFNATGVAEICSTASVSKGAFYHHFPSKQAVFLALLQDWLQNIDNQLEASRQQGSSIPQVLQSMSELMSLCAGRPCLRKASKRASRPICSASSRRSRLNHCLILLRAPELCTDCSQSREGP